MLRGVRSTIRTDDAEGAMIRVKQKGDFRNTERFFAKAKGRVYFNVLRKYGQLGVEALSASTPKDSGETAKSWKYEIERTDDGVVLGFVNTHENDGVNVAILLRYGHGTGTGGFVVGRNYIDPAIRPIFDELANAVWKEVTT